jgi:hypothetical protein
MAPEMAPDVKPLRHQRTASQYPDLKSALENQCATSTGSIAGMTQPVRDLDYSSFKMNMLKAMIFKIDFEVITTYVEVETVESISAFKSFNRRLRQFSRLFFVSRVE